MNNCTEKLRKCSGFVKPGYLVLDYFASLIPSWSDFDEKALHCSMFSPFVDNGFSSLESRSFVTLSR